MLGGMPEAGHTQSRPHLVLSKCVKMGGGGGPGTPNPCCNQHEPFVRQNGLALSQLHFAVKMVHFDVEVDWSEIQLVWMFLPPRASAMRLTTQMAGHVGTFMES